MCAGRWWWWGKRWECYSDRNSTGTSTGTSTVTWPVPFCPDYDGQEQVWSGDRQALHRVEGRENIVTVCNVTWPDSGSRAGGTGLVVRSGMM